MMCKITKQIISLRSIIPVHFLPLENCLVPLNNVSLHFINGLNINFKFDKNLRINIVLPHLKLLFNSITAATEEFSQFTPA